MSPIAEVLSDLTPDQLFPFWSWIDSMEREGAISGDETSRWKLGVFALMELWELEPGDLVNVLDVDL